ncbi:hypothetical protein [Pseudoalteromonas rhizosphaerae]|uniref:Uncharacterized protein n=1 Tax=Pseudoalteromonas rhizosphaerae TaxID=2518973 RepID=A0ABW8KUJ5_9GAMM
MYTIIYGISSPTELFLKSSINTGNNLFACTDGGESYKGTQALSLEDLALVPHDQIDRIIICSMFVSEICNGLREKGLPLERTYFFDHTKKKLIHYNALLAKQVSSEDILYAVYDLSVHLACFDVINFVVLAEIARIEQHKTHIQFILVHDRSTAGENFNTLRFHDADDYAWRIEKIVKTVFTCVPSYISITEFPFKEDAFIFLATKENVFPESYYTNKKSPAINTLLLRSVPLKYDMSVLSAPLVGKNLAASFLNSLPDNKKIIVITLREYEAQPKRNSDIAQWSAFLDSLDLTIYCPVIIRDTYQSTEKPDDRLKKYIHCPQASMDFCVRLALYELAYINMGVSSGPNYSISFVKGARSIIFQMIDENNPASSSWTAKRSGLEIGKDFFFNDSKLQMTIWEKDDLNHLQHAFDILVARINTLTKINPQQAGQ